MAGKVTKFNYKLFVKKISINLLRKLKDVNKLIQRLEDDNKDIVAQAVIALGELKNKSAVEPLIATLKDKNECLRSVIVTALFKIGIPAVEFLIVALNDKNECVRAGAAEALGKIKDLRAVKPLVEMLHNEEWPFFWGKGYKDPDIHEDEFIIPYAVADALSKIGTPAAEVLIAALKTALKEYEDVLAWTLIRALGEIKDVRAIEPLIVALEYDWDKWEYIQLEAELALCKIGHPATDFLIAALENKNVDAKAVVARILGDIGDLRAVEPLISLLNDENEDVRLQAIIALGEIEDVRMVKPLNAALNDKSERVRRAVVIVLRDMKNIEP